MEGLDVPCTPTSPFLVIIPRRRPQTTYWNPLLVLAVVAGSHCSSLVPVPSSLFPLPSFLFPVPSSLILGQLTWVTCPGSPVLRSSTLGSPVLVSLGGLAWAHLSLGHLSLGRIVLCHRESCPWVLGLTFPHVPLEPVLWSPALGHWSLGHPSLCTLEACP